MSALLVAVFKDYGLAEQTRIELFHDGFPTDRVNVTALSQLGQASLQPADSLHGKLVQYFRSLLAFEAERHLADQLAERVETGAATVTVHPRGTIETAHAMKILQEAGSAEIVQHDLAHQAWEHAAARRDTPWIGNLLAERTSKAHCIYCRLFEADLD